MKTYTPSELTEIIRKHHLYLEHEKGGERANLRYADLRFADLRYANLRSADLSYANLSSANLSFANLSYANLSSADLSYANLSFADLSSADLSSADLSYASAGNNIEVKTLQLGKYYTVISAYKVRVGCQSHTLEEWKGFDDRAILEMDGKDGLIWWKQWRDVIFQVAATIPTPEVK